MSIYKLCEYTTRYNMECRTFTGTLVFLIPSATQTNLEYKCDK